MDETYPGFDALCNASALQILRWQRMLPKPTNSSEVATMNEIARRVECIPRDQRTELAKSFA
jgi:hypothetical protein